MEYTERKRWVFFGLPFTFTKYVVKEDMITIDEGLLKTIENDCFMYKVQDVTHTASLAEKLFGLGTVTCYTGDTTHPQLVLQHIRHSKELKEFILKQSEEARLKRRTVNMLDIGSGDMEDMGDGDDWGFVGTLGVRSSWAGILRETEKFSGNHWVSGAAICRNRMTEAARTVIRR